MIVITGVVAFYFNRKQVIIRTLSKIPNKPTSSLKTNQLSKLAEKHYTLKRP